MIQHGNLETIFNNVSTAQVSSKIVTLGYRYVCIQAHGTGTIRVRGSLSETVNFSSASSATNMWNYIDLADLNSGASINQGTAGIILTSSTGLYEINACALHSIAIEVSGTVSGLTIVCRGYYE